MTEKHGSRRTLALAAVTAVAGALVAGLAARPPARLHLDAGSVVGGLLGHGWSESNRTSLDPEVGALDPEATELGKQFRFRAARPGAVLDLPVAAREGRLRLTFRALARVRTAVELFANGRTAAQFTVPKAKWSDYPVELQTADSQEAGVRATLSLQPLPLVRVPDEYLRRPLLWVSAVTAEAPGGLRFAPRARVLLGLVPLAVFAFAGAVGFRAALALIASLATAACVLLLAWVAPLPLLVAIPRLLPVALGAGLFTAFLLRRTEATTRATAAAIASLVAAGILAHGALPFVPTHDPYDVEVHVRRARDLGNVPLEYGALLRYGSHLPTETQTFGTATAALGERTLIPYSPLPYLGFYALHAADLDLHWGMTALDALLLVLVVPLMWVVASRVWSVAAAWIAVLLYTLDLPIWHHLARAHVPASFGGALATAGLLFLTLRAAQLDTPRRMAGAACILCVAILGYSSSLVLFGLFGMVLLAVVAVDAAGLSLAAKRGLVASLVGGGLLACLLFYVHYLPGLLHGVAPLQNEPDLFRPRTYLIFHNESRQMMKVWAAGFAIPLFAGLLAAPFALRSAIPDARPVLAAWLFTWPLVMLAKEPFLFPRPLRWAKEDQFIAPLLALLVGAALGRLPQPWMRWAAGALAVTVAAWLQWGDYAGHALGTN